MATIAEKLQRLRLLRQQTTTLRNEVATAKANLITSSSPYIHSLDTANTTTYNNTSNTINNTSKINNRYPTENDIRHEATAAIRRKQQLLQDQLARQHASSSMISSIMASMPNIDYEAEASRLILRDGKKSLANAIANGHGNHITHGKAHLHNIRKVTIYDAPNNSYTSADCSEISDIDFSDDNITDSEDDGIEIDYSIYPNMDPIRTRPTTPELDSIAASLTDDDIASYVKEEYDKNIKTIKCWCIMANNSGYELFDSHEIDIIKNHLDNYQLIPIYSRAYTDDVNWLGMFIQWLYIDTNNYDGARCRFGRGWIIKYYPNYYHGDCPRVIVSTKYRPDFNNDQHISSIFASGYTLSINLDGKTPIFRQIIIDDVALFNNTSK